MPKEVKLTQQEIHDRLQELAASIAKEYQGKNVLLLGILKGAAILISDFIRLLWQEGLKDCELAFMTIQSYGSDTESSKNPHITHDSDIDVSQRHVLIIEDIVDTGYSLQALQQMLQARNPHSLKTFVLLSKQSRREVDVTVDYIGFEVEGWVEGYGLDDTEQKGRGRPEIVEIVS